MPTNKTLFEKVIEALPELADNKEPFQSMQIILQNDSDGSGDYIAKWEYKDPLPASLQSYYRA